MSVPDAKRLKELESRNAHLKKLQENFRTRTKVQDTQELDNLLWRSG